MTTGHKQNAVVDTLASPLAGGGGKHTKGGSNSTAAAAAAISASALMPETERQAAILAQLISDDIPVRLYQFRQAMEAEVVVTKRLYLVKCEYRVPFRSFLEAHQMLLRTPPMELVDHYLRQRSSGGGSSGDKSNETSELDDLKAKLQSLLNTPELIEMLALEMKGEKIELALGEALFPFSELARSLDHKKARLKAVPGILKYNELPKIQECVRVSIYFFVF
jgi:hypothetical protein